MPSKKQNLDYLKLLSERYPNVESSVRAIVDMSSILRLPKGTEYFFSDLHGENGAFIQLLRSASGVIRDKIDTVYSFTLSEKERDELAALIAHPHTFLSTKRKGCAEADYEDWSALVIHRLVQVLQRLTDAGNTVLVIEHNLDMIKTADYLIDLGPEGGDGGGQIVAQGTPEQVAQVKKSYTGQFLREML